MWIKFKKLNKYKVHGFLTCAFLFSAFWFTYNFEPKRIPAQAVDESKALEFLDSRSANWITTTISNNHDGGTRCLSCHTTLSYTLTRPEYGDTPELQKIKSLIEARVKEFDANGFNGAWYSQFEKGSLSTEAVINALSLTSMDLPGNNINPLTELALKQMWDRQLTSGIDLGGFDWLDGYDLAPLESKNAGYWATATIATVVTDIPGYTSRIDVAPKIASLKKYLANNFDEQELHNQLIAIEADKKLGSNVIPKAKVDKTMAKVLSLMETNGGWDLHKLVGRPGIGMSDNYATAIVIKAFVQTGKANHPKIKKALSWLRGNQNAEIRNQYLPGNSCSSIVGAFFGHSVNHNRTSLFMTDLATAYSLKALKMAKAAGL